MVLAGHQLRLATALAGAARRFALLLALPVLIGAGPAQVIDGDTPEVAGERIRLIGIDAPEGDQICQRHGWEWACGVDATIAPGELVKGAEVRCEVLGRHRWGRGLAVCFVGELEVNREMVRRGWALAYYPERGAIPGPAYDAEQLGWTIARSVTNSRSRSASRTHAAAISCAGSSRIT